MLDFSKYQSILSLGTSLNPIQIAYLHSDADIRAIFKGNQGGGCLRWDVNIPLADGRVKKIRDVVPGDFALGIDDSYKIVSSCVIQKIDSGIKRFFEIKTRSGRRLVATGCHPFLTIDGWKPLSALTDGTYIATPRHLPAMGQDERPTWEYKILGYLIGDGTITDGGARISNLDEKIINEIAEIIPGNLALKHIKNGDYRISQKTKTRKRGHNGVTNLLRETGLLGTSSYTKHIPDIVWRANPQNAALFLSRLFSCDGWVDTKQIGYASVSSELIQGVQSLLLRFGILSRIRAKKNRNWGTNSHKTEERTDYQLTIKRLSDLTRFSRMIGIFSKQDKLNALLQKRNTETPKENTDIVPVDIHGFIAKLPRRIKNNNIQRTNWVYEDNSLYRLCREMRGRTITRDKMQVLGNALADKWAQNLAVSDVFWDQINAIAPIGEDRAYDLEIEGTHNFIANNIFAHNTAATAMDIALRLLRIHPVKKRNVLNKPIRCVSKVKPKQEGDEENQQYVELLRLIPQYLIRKDVTARSSILVVRDPLGGADNKVDFMSSSQELDAFMSVQRSALYQDEEIEKIKWDESLIRLLKEGGDATINCTPAKGLDWVYDSIWRRASKIYRSKLICEKFPFQEVEEPGGLSGIECFVWATDDNPAMTPSAIEQIMGMVDDPDDLAMRRYGVFKQVSGVIYKVFNPLIHKQPYDKVFDASLFRTYWNFRIIDYHPTKPWAVSWVVVSPHHEWFIWHEIEARHEHRTTLELRDEIKAESLLQEDEMYNRCTLIDPLSQVKQANTGFSVFDDLSMGEFGLRRLTSADTKNESGRMNIKMRMKNSLICGVPGNNLNRGQFKEERYGDYLPTIWILDNCKKHLESYKNWRLREPKQEHLKAIGAPKKPIEKYSDFCRNIEFLGNLNPVFYEPKKEFWEPSKLFQGRRAA